MSARKVKAKRLTIPGFLKLLRKHKSPHWFLMCDGIRCKQPGGRAACPLTYVAWPDGYVSAFQWREAARKLNITEEDAEKIIAAADIQNLRGKGAELRRELLNILGLVPAL